MAAEAEAAPAVPARPKSFGKPFLPGRAKTGGRKKGVRNTDRAVNIERILAMADPIGVLCRIANGEAIMAAPEPGAAPSLLHPTIVDRLSALRILATKVMPDLKQVSVDGGGAQVAVFLQLGQQVNLGQQLNLGTAPPESPSPSPSPSPSS